MAWALDDEEPGLWVPGEPLPAPVRDHVVANGLVCAHNAPFELEIWNQIMVPRCGWPELEPDQAVCTMAMAYAMALPGALEDAALALGLSLLKDAEGRALMLRMARPRRMENGQPVWWDEPEKLTRLYEYCRQDVRVERALHERLMPLSATERSVWLMDYAINQRGVRVDIPTAKAAVKLVDVVKERCDAKLNTITGGAVQKATAIGALKAWLDGAGFPMESLAKQEVTDILDVREDLPQNVRDVLILRQEAGKASTAKLSPLILTAGKDERMHGIFQYHGAATGRWAGRKVQPHNLPRINEDDFPMDEILALVNRGAVDAIDMIYGPPMAMVSRCLRGFFIPAEGHVFVAGDWSNVEGRGVAWFSGEEWKTKAFLAADAKTGPGIYELGAARILGITPDQVTKAQRQSHGKVPELALGYQGGVGAFQTMASTYGVKITDAEAEAIKVAWRLQHPRTVQTWYALQRAAIAAVQNPGQAFEAGHPRRPVKFKVAGSFLWCLLPSGRALCYPYPKVLEGDFGPQLTYMTVPGADAKKKGKIVYDVKNTSNWARVGTYGGMLLENIVQAFCRDLLAHTMLTLHGAGAKIVMHVHDEIVIEVLKEKAETARRAMEKMMGTPPAWAAGFPLYADCEILDRYGK